MSSSATTAAKRRRAGNIVASPLFKSGPTSGSNESIQRRVNRTTENLQNDTIQQLNTEQPTNTTTATDFKKPMSLQQVITVFDKRLLTLEKAIIENANNTNNTNNTETSRTNVSINNELNTEFIEKTMESFREDINVTLNEQSKEFDYRTTVLANEITNLKETVLKLQTYTMDVNKSLLEERAFIYSEHEENIKIEIDDINQELTDYTENISEELNESNEEKEEDQVELQEEEEQVQEEEQVELQEEEQVQEEEQIELQEEEEQVELQEEEQVELQEEEEEEPIQVLESNEKKKSKRKKKDKSSLSVNV